MALNRWIWFIVLLLAVYFVLAPWLGLSGSLWVTVAFAFALALTLDYFNVLRIFPFKLKRNIALILMVVLWGFTAYSAGWLSGILPTGAVTTTGFKEPTRVPKAGCSVSEELRGKAATITVNAWDLESNTPYSSPVDFATNCFDYKNGNSPTSFVGNSSDTSSGSLGGYVVGDTLYMYCGGSTYYGESIEGWCIDNQYPTLVINAHTISTADSSNSITVYDNTGGTVLSTGAGTDGDSDYYMSLGAGADDSIYVKLKVNAANKAYQFCAWGVAEFYNISKVSPQNVEATYTNVPTPQHMKSISIRVNTSGSNTDIDGQDYTVYRASAPIMLHEWDSIKEKFVVEADDTYDPIGGNTGTNQSTLNGFAILAKDCTYSRGDDGKVYLDFYQHDSAQADVGMDEVETSPAGKTDSTLISVR